MLELGGGVTVGFYAFDEIGGACMREEGVCDMGLV